MTKIIKRVKDYTYRERLKKIGLSTLLERRIRGNRIETFKIINGISNHVRHYLNISPSIGNLLSKQILKN